MSQISITDFLDEILEKIFWDVYNSGGSLKTLTEVCKRFNHVICSHTKFMSKFAAVCKWDKSSIEALHASNRKYHEIKIVNSYDVMTHTFLDVLKIQNKSLTSFVMSHCEVGVSKLRKIFETAKNIREIRIENVRIFYDQWPLSLNLPMLKKIILCNIKDKGVTPMLNIFRGAENVEECELNDVDLQYDQVFHDNLSTFLSKFTKLKRFANKFCLFPVFLQTRLDENITYQLEELTLDGRYFYVFNLSYNDKIINYINKHQQSLKKLQLYGFVITNEIIECAFSLDQLAELAIRNCNFYSEPRINILNYSIKKLTFEAKSILRLPDLNADVNVCHILLNCKNVTEVSFVSMNITEEVSSVIAAKKNIEKLNFISCTIFPMTYSSVKSMELRGIRIYFKDM